MGRPSPRLRTLRRELAHRYPRLEDPGALIAAGDVLVNGFPRVNPTSLVGAQDSIKLRPSSPLRGSAKLAHALRVFDVAVRGRVAVDLGASAGGFTQVLLEAGAARVYAVDVGYGQLRGGLRQDPRVVNLERTNLGALDSELVPDPIGLISIDLSYLSIAAAADQLHQLAIQPAADLVALVKPAYELRLQGPPTDEALLDAAVSHAQQGLEANDWAFVARERSPVPGARGAIEYLLHARRSDALGPYVSNDVVPRSRPA